MDAGRDGPMTIAKREKSHPSPYKHTGYHTSKVYAHLQLSEGIGTRAHKYWYHSLLRTMHTCVLAVVFSGIAVIGNTSTLWRPYCIAMGFGLLPF